MPVTLLFSRERYRKHFLYVTRLSYEAAMTSVFLRGAYLACEASTGARFVLTRGIFIARRSNIQYGIPSEDT